jgi:hypothetical protein
MRSIIIFAVIQLLSFVLGKSDALTIAIAVLVSSISIFGAAYLSVYLKDRLDRKKFLKTILES